MSTAVGLANAVVWPWVSAHDQRMEYRGVRYTIRVGIEPDLLSVAIYPSGVESVANRFYGTRANAEFRARSLIERWLKEHRDRQSNAERK
jgi:hypothetical protein